MTPVQACTGCGRIHSFLPRGLCVDCIDARETQYRTLRDWLTHNRGASIAEASEATGLAEALILSYVREGRLDTVDPELVAELVALRARIRLHLASQAEPRDDEPPPVMMWSRFL